MRKIILGLSLIMFIGITESCQKSSDLINSSSLSEATLSSNVKAAENSISSTEINLCGTEDIQSVAIYQFDIKDALGGKGMGKGMHFGIPKISDCATVSVSDTIYPKTITIDYGSGCTDKKGRIKKGKIIINISDSMKIAGSVKTVSYEDFYVDSDKIEMTSTFKNTGKNSSGNWVLVNDYIQKITRSNGEIITETYADTIEWLSGFETIDKSDDIFSKTGGGTINVNDSIVFNRNIIKALVFDASCGSITSGIIELVKNGDNILINYGDGTCDSKATVSINGVSEEINIRMGRFGEGGEFGKHRGGCDGSEKGKRGHGGHGRG